MFWFYKNLTPFRFLQILFKQTEMKTESKMLCSTANKIESKLSPVLTNIRRLIPTKPMSKCKSQVASYPTWVDNFLIK